MNVFELVATLDLDSSKYDSGLSNAKSAGSLLGSGLASSAKVGLAAVTAAATAVTGFGAAAVKTGMSFDQSISQVSATMGMTVSEMEQQVASVKTAYGEFTGNLREFAEFMGVNTVFSATEAAEALNYMALAGYDVQESMQMLPNVLNLAAAGNFDLATASDMVTDAQTAFNVSMEDMPQLIDEMAKAASTGNTSVQQLGDAFLVVGGLAQELNGGMVTLSDGTQAPVSGIQELEIALTAMANAGIKGSEAGTHMRNMLLKLSDPTSAGAAALEQMGVAIFDTEGNMRSLSDIFGDLSAVMADMTQEDKISAISDLFNTRDIASAEALLNAVSQDWDSIGGAILDAEGAAAKMAETQLDNLAGDTTLFKSALEGLQIVVSDVLTPSLREFVQFGTDGLQRLTAAFNTGGLSGAMDEFGLILSDGLAMIIEKLPEFMSAGISLIEALGSGIVDNLDLILDAVLQVVDIFGQFIGENLEPLMDAALTILFTLADYITGNVGELIPAVVNIILMIVEKLTSEETITSLMEAATQLLIGLANGISEALPMLAERVPDIIASIVAALVDNAPELIGAALTLIESLAEGLLESLPILLDRLPEMIDRIVTALITSLPELVEFVVEFEKTMAEMIIENLPILLDKVPEVVTNIIRVLSENAPQLIEAAVEIISQLTQGIVDYIPMLVEMLPTVIEAITSNLIENSVDMVEVAIELIAQLIQGIIGALPTLIAMTPEIIVAIVATLIENFPQILETGISLLETLGEGILMMIPLMIEAAVTIIGALIEGILDAGANLTNIGADLLTTLKNALLNGDAITWGKDLIQNFVDGILGSIDVVRNGVSKVAETVKGLIGFSEPEFGPLSNFHTYAPDMMHLFAEGIRDNESIVSDQIADSFDFGDKLVDVSAYDAGNGNSSGGYSGGIVQNVTINSPQELDPIDTARQVKNAGQELLLAMRGIS